MLPPQSKLPTSKAFSRKKNSSDDLGEATFACPVVSSLDELVQPLPDVPGMDPEVDQEHPLDHVAEAVCLVQQRMGESGLKPIATS